MHERAAADTTSPDGEAFSRHAHTMLSDLCHAYGLELTAAPRRIAPRVWRLPATSGDVAAKLHREGGPAVGWPASTTATAVLHRVGARKRARTEAAILHHLQDVQAKQAAIPGIAGFRVQTVQPTRAGEPLWEGEHAGALVTRWECGSVKSYDIFSLAEWSALGASLAALHVALDTCAPLPRDTLHARLDAIDIDDVRHSLHADLASAGRREQSSVFRRYVQDCLRLIDDHYLGSVEDFPSTDPQCPIHNDFNQFNYLFGHTLPPVILDWEASIGAPRAYEVVRCLNHLPLEHPERARHFLRAYRAVRPLDVSHLEWAVDAATLQHALKRWVVQGWLDAPVAFGEHLVGNARMTAMMTGARSRLIDFYLRCGDPAP